MEHFQRKDNLTYSPNNIFMRYTYTQIAEGGGVRFLFSPFYTLVNDSIYKLTTE